MSGIDPLEAVAITSGPQPLGERGGGYDDQSYTGEQSSSPLSLDYYREKGREFQMTLNAVDAAYRAALAALEIPGLDPASAYELRESVNDYLSKKGWLKGTAEAINMGASLINSAGGRMPEISVPQTLGFIPAIPLASIAAYGAVAAAVVWGREWILGVNTRLARAQLIQAQTTPDAQAALAASIAQGDQAAAMAEGSPFAGFAGVVKWGAIAALGFFAWRAFSNYRRENPALTYEPDDED